MRLVPSSIRSSLCCLTAFAALVAPMAAWAGPPFLTDDPEPTETGRWEIYGPFLEVAGLGSAYDGSVGIEVNYGAAPDLQLTVGLPAAFARHDGRFLSGAGDVEVSAKYRLVNDEAAGLAVAFFPGLTLPTASNHMGNSKVTGFLPVWIQKDIASWSIFGGGGYAINPGVGNRDYWTGGAAIARQVSSSLDVGLEAKRQGPDTVGARSTTRLGLGAKYLLRGSIRPRAARHSRMAAERRGFTPTSLWDWISDPSVFLLRTDAARDWRGSCQVQDSTA